MFTQNLPESELRMRVRLIGEDIPSLVRVGNVVFEEAVDDTGKSLVDPATTTEERRTVTRRVFTPPEAIARSGWPLATALKASDRGAKTLKTLKGSVRVLFAKDSEDVIVINPLQFSGGIIAHPRLKELGIEVKLLPPGTPPEVVSHERALAIQVTAGDEKLRKVEFCDAWLRPVRTRPPADRRLEDGSMCMVYDTLGVPFDETTQMIIEVLPNVRDERVEFSFTDVKLP